MARKDTWLTVKQAVAYLGNEGGDVAAAARIRNAIKNHRVFWNFDAEGNRVDLDAADPAVQNARHRPDDSVDYTIVEVRSGALEEYKRLVESGEVRRATRGPRKYIIALTAEDLDAFRAGTFDTRSAELRPAYANRRAQMREADARGDGLTESGAQPEDARPDAELFSTPA